MVPIFASHSPGHGRLFCATQLLAKAMFQHGLPIAIGAGGFVGSISMDVGNAWEGEGQRGGSGGQEFPVEDK